MFSSLNWNKLSVSDKAAHSLSNCYACANTFLKLQKSFPLAPIYKPNSLSESASEKSFIENEYPKFDSLCKQTVGQPFSVLANRHPDIMGFRNTNSEVQKAIRDTQRKCTAECNASLEKSTLQAAYSTDFSLVGYKGTVKLNIMSLQMNQVKRRNVIHFSPISAIDMMNLLTNLQIGMIRLLSSPHH